MLSGQGQSSKALPFERTNSNPYLSCPHNIIEIIPHPKANKIVQGRQINLTLFLHEIKRMFYIVLLILDREEKEMQLTLENLVRAYDPCISCSTH